MEPATRVIDLHTHLLPDLDDGPATAKEAIAMARAAVAAGVSELVATPHVSSRYPNDAHTIHQALDELRAELEQAGVPLVVHAGAEIELDRALTLAPEELERLRLGGGPFLLIESPLGEASSDAELVVRTLRARGHRILLAHPERSPLFQREPAQLARLVAEGALTSVTASAFAGRFGRSAQRSAFRLLHDGLLHNLASDMHDLHHRPPGIAAPPRAADDDPARHAARFAWHTEGVPAAILSGGTLPPGPAPPPRPRRSIEHVPGLRRLGQLLAG